MAYRKFSTEAADYALCYNIHFQEQDDNIFSKEKIQSIDAIVLEGSWHAQPNSQVHLSSGQWPEAYTQVKNSILKNKPHIKIFFADAEVKHRILHGYETAASLLVGASMYALTGHKEFYDLSIAYFGVSAGVHFAAAFAAALGETKICPELVSGSELFIPTVHCTLRNAVAAKKIEEYIVPSLPPKPNIAIIYGAAHAGLEGCLKSKRRRDSIIKFYKFFNYPRMNKETLGAITELKRWMEYPDIPLWKTIQHKTGEF